MTETGKQMAPRGFPACAKRVFDLTGATVLLALSSPLLALAALMVRIDTHGSAIYRQQRVGRGGRLFDIYKLRTMVAGAEKMGAGLSINEGDPRITRVGALLRRFSLDELPNLINVLRGEMGLVGPRPTLSYQVDRYTDRQRLRLVVKPGITGWAQVNGRAGLPWADRIELDVWYVENWSLWLDLKILAKTARMLATGHGLYKGESGGWKDPGAS